MFGPSCIPPKLRRYVLEGDVPEFTPYRGVYVLDDDTSPEVRILIRATDPGIVLPQSELEFAFAGVSGNTLAEEHS
jgi:hypothetical protein